MSRFYRDLRPEYLKARPKKTLPTWLLLILCVPLVWGVVWPIVWLLWRAIVGK